jgi:hypothetical protein
MRFVISWEQTTTHSATVEISLADLSSWAVAHLPLRGLPGGSGTTVPTALQLETSLAKNPHLRDRLLQLYAASLDQGSTIHQHGPRIMAVNGTD